MKMFAVRDTVFLIPPRMSDLGRQTGSAVLNESITGFDREADIRFAIGLRRNRRLDAYDVATSQRCNEAACVAEALDRQQLLQRLLSGLTRFFPRTELVAGFLHWKHFIFAVDFPGISVRRGAPVFYFHAKRVCD
ncbi:MAG TPA: hypothetical protein VGJ20_00105 [Xanthobacteraceae bacterium]